MLQRNKGKRLTKYIEDYVVFDLETTGTMTFPTFQASTTSVESTINSEAREANATALGIVSVAEASVTVPEGSSADYVVRALTWSGTDMIPLNEAVEIK